MVDLTAVGPDWRAPGVGTGLDALLGQPVSVQALVDSGCGPHAASPRRCPAMHEGLAEPAASGARGQARGLVLDEQGLALQGGPVHPGVVAAEQQLSRTQHHTYVGLCAAGVTTVSRGQGTVSAGGGGRRVRHGHGCHRRGDGGAGRAHNRITPQPAGRPVPGKAAFRPWRSVCAKGELGRLARDAALSAQ